MASETADFYKNKNIFITGGTGFLGIAIIEKLLRTTPEVAVLFHLIFLQIFCKCDIELIFIVLLKFFSNKRSEKFTC